MIVGSECRRRRLLLEIGVGGFIRGLFGRLRTCGGCFRAAFGGSLCVGSGLILFAVEAVHGADDEKDNEGDDEEVDDVLDEITVSDSCDGIGAEDVGNVDRKGGEIEAASEETGNGHDNVVDKGFDN